MREIKKLNHNHSLVNLTECRQELEQIQLSFKPVPISKGNTVYSWYISCI